MPETTVEALDPNFRLELPEFEGPLDLLLHLIRKHELEILELPVAFVTERYLEYVSMMEKLNLDIASEYLVMAATLAHIKSKMLLPPQPGEEDEDDAFEEEVDPRAELIRRLLEYQKYKKAAGQLAERGIAGRDVFARGSEAPKAVGAAPLASTSLFKLMDAFAGILKRANAELAFEITTDGMSIQERMQQLTELLTERRELAFEGLFESEATVYDLVITFMAILEMAKRRLVQIYQADPHSPIHLRSTMIADQAEPSDGELEPEDVGDFEPAASELAPADDGGFDPTASELAPVDDGGLESAEPGGFELEDETVVETSAARLGDDGPLATEDEAFDDGAFDDESFDGAAWEDDTEVRASSYVGEVMAPPEASDEDELLPQGTPGMSEEGPASEAAEGAPADQNESADTPSMDDEES